LTCIQGRAPTSTTPRTLQLTATIGGERFEVTDDWFEDGVLRLDTALPPEVDGSRSSLGSRKAEPARLRQQSISICLSQEAWMGGILLLWDAAWVAVLEYLIKATSGEDLVLARGSVDQVLAPQSRPSQRVSGWGDYRIAVADGQVGFSWEAPGWQVMVEGMPEADAEGIVTEIAAQIGAATGQPTTWLAL
jgi:hypothetical protein